MLVVVNFDKMLNRKGAKPQSFAKIFFALPGVLATLRLRGLKFDHCRNVRVFSCRFLAKKIA